MFLSWNDYFDLARAWEPLLSKSEVKGALPVLFQLIEPKSLNDYAWVRMSMAVPCVRTGSGSTIVLQSPIPAYMKDDRERLQWLRREVHSFYRHEADEQFRFDGNAIFEPHDEHAKI